VSQHDAVPSSDLNYVLGVGVRFPVAATSLAAKT
jgi:hypothetical protein